MTIRKRIIIAALIQGLLICIICFFAYISFKTVLTRLRTIEVIDDLNISLLEMRKAEKNYFLYHDLTALEELIKLGQERYDQLKSAKSYVVPGLHDWTKKNYEVLLETLIKYSELAGQVVRTRQAPPHLEEELRKLGHELTTSSEVLLKKERENVNEIINHNIIMLIASLGLILLVQVVLWQYFFRFIIQEMNIMEQMIRKVSEGRFHEVAVTSIAPHNEIETAIKAISDMAGELERREAELLQSGKLASLGVLISGVAHELGNPLNNISLIAQTYLSLYDLLGDEEKKTYMGDVYVQSERIKKIVENLLDFSRQKKQELKEHQLGEMVQHSIGLVGHHLKLSKVKHHVSVAEDLPPVRVDAAQIEQVLINLFINAIQAMPQGGDLFIEAYPENHDWAVVKIRDTGTGIKKEVMPYIFDPFFTTKSTRGTGLGLSVSYGIIRQHQGEIAVESEEGQGTTFIIKIPAWKKENRGDEYVSENNRHR
jgi:two-component system NtrC family sensor kinase